MPLQSKKLAAVRLALERQLNAAQIAQRVGISHQHFFTWMRHLNQEGLTGLLRRRHGGGKKTAIEGEILAGLKKQFAANMTASEVQAWLAQKGIGLSKCNIYYWRRRLGFARPRHDPGDKEETHANHHTESVLALQLDDPKAWQEARDKSPFLEVEKRLDAILWLDQRSRALEEGRGGDVNPDYEIKNIAEALGCPVKSLYRWVERYREVEGDLNLFTATSINSELWQPGVFDALKAAFESGEADTGPKAVNWFQRRGVEISLSTAYRWLEKCGKIRNVSNEED